MPSYIFFIFFLIIVMFFLYNKRFRGGKDTRDQEEMTRYFSGLRNPDSPEAKEEMKKRMNESMQKKYGHKMTDEEFEEAFMAMKEWVRKNSKSE